MFATVDEQVAYAENFNGGFSFSGVWWSLHLVCAFCDVRHIHVFKRSLLT